MLWQGVAVADFLFHLMRSVHPSAPISGPDAPSALENFLDLHIRKILIGIAAVLAVVAIVATVHLKRKKFEREAGAALVAAKDLDAMRKVIETYGDTPAGQTAQLLLADRQLAANDAKAAEATLRGFIATNAKHPLASQAKITLAATLIRLGQLDAAGSELAGFLQSSPTSSLAPLAMVMQAELAEEKGDTEGARKIYEEAKANYPDSNFGFLAGSRIDRVGFVMPTEIDAPPPPPPPAPTPGTSTLPGADVEIPKPLPGSAVPPGITVKPLDEPPAEAPAPVAPAAPAGK